MLLPKEPGESTGPKPRSFRKPLLSIAALLLACRAPARAETAAVEFIPRGGYFSALKSAVEGASAAVTCYVYLYSLYVNNPDDQPSQLAAALAAAARRGVRVEVVFNGPSDWGEEAQENLDDRNRAAAEFLHRQGVRVFFEGSPALLHAKVAVIDDALALLGSSNWSRKAFMDNIEADLLVRDPSFARKVAAEMAAIPRLPFVSEDADAVRLPAAFLTSPEGLGLMSRRKDETAFNVYAWLLKEAQEPGAPAVLKVDLDALAERLGKAGGTRGGRRLFVTRALKALRDRYKLLSITFHDGADAEAALVPASGEVVTLPRDYWTHGWDRRLQFPGKIMLLMGRYYSDRSPTRPRWSRSKYTLERDHGVSESTLDRGTVELERADLLEVRNSDLPLPGQTRRPNEYTPNPLYDFRDRQRRREALAEKLGRDKVDRAARIAAEFYEDWDLDAIQALAGLEDDHGRDKVSRAVRRVAALRPDNPKRNIAYLIAAIKNPERPDQLPSPAGSRF